MDDPIIAKSDHNDSGNPVQEMIAAPAQVPAPDEAQVPAGGEAQVPEAEQAQVPVAEEVQVPNAEEAEVPVAEEVQVPVAEEAQVPDAEQAQVPDAEEVQVPVAEEVQVPAAEDAQARSGGQAAGDRRRRPLVVPVLLATPPSSGAAAAAAAGAGEDPPPTYEQCAGARQLLPAIAIVLQAPKPSVNAEGAGAAGRRLGCIRVLRPQQVASALRLARKGRPAHRQAAPAPAPAHDVEGKHTTRQWPQRLATLLVGLICLAVGYLDGWSAFALSFFKGLPRATGEEGACRGNASLMGSMVLSGLLVGPTPFQGPLHRPISSLVALGGLLGALPAGALAESIGRKGSVLLLTVPVIAAWALTLICNDSLFGMYFSRLMVGFTMGVASIVVPIYTEEIAEVRVRGALCVWARALRHAGLALAVALGVALPFPHTTLLPCFVPLALLVLLPGVPESPAFLVRKGLLREARLALRFLRGRWADVEQELSALRERLRPQRGPAPAHAAAAAEGPLGACAAWLSLSQHRGTRATLLLMLFRQLSGVHAVAFFTVDMFSAAESAVSGQVCAVMIGVVQIAATVLCSLAVDTVGRRPLLFFSALGMAVCHMGLAYYFKFLVAGEDARGVWWLPVLMVSGFIVMYSLGLGPLPWLLMAELVPVRDRRWAAGLAGAVNWGAMYLVFQAYSLFTGVAGYQFAFLFFSMTCFTGSVFVSLCVPETMGKTLEEIQDTLHGVIKNQEE